MSLVSLCPSVELVRQLSTGELPADQMPIRLILWQNTSIIVRPVPSRSNPWRRPIHLALPRKPPPATRYPPELLRVMDQLRQR